MKIWSLFLSIYIIQSLTGMETDPKVEFEYKYEQFLTKYPNLSKDAEMQHAFCNIVHFYDELWHHMCKLYETLKLQQFCAPDVVLNNKIIRQIKPTNLVYTEQAKNDSVLFAKKKYAQMDQDQLISAKIAMNNSEVYPLDVQNPTQFLFFAYISKQFGLERGLFSQLTASTPFFNFEELQKLAKNDFDKKIVNLFSFWSLELCTISQLLKKTPALQQRILSEDEHFEHIERITLNGNSLEDTFLYKILNNIKEFTPKLETIRGLKLYHLSKSKPYAKNTINFIHDFLKILPEYPQIEKILYLCVSEARENTERSYYSHTTRATILSANIPYLKNMFEAFKIVTRDTYKRCYPLLQNKQKHPMIWGPLDSKDMYLTSPELIYIYNEVEKIEQKEPLVQVQPTKKQIQKKQPHNKKKTQKPKSSFKKNLLETDSVPAIKPIVLPEILAPQPTYGRLYYKSDYISYCQTIIEQNNYHKYPFLLDYLCIDHGNRINQDRALKYYAPIITTQLDGRNAHYFFHEVVMDQKSVIFHRGTKKITDAKHLENSFAAKNPKFQKAAYDASFPVLGAQENGTDSTKEGDGQPLAYTPQSDQFLTIEGDEFLTNSIFPATIVETNDIYTKLTAPHLSTIIFVPKKF